MAVVDNQVSSRYKTLWTLRGRDRAIHFIGIGGIGVSALARWFMAQGWSVTGSDLERSALTDELAKEGAKITIGSKKSVVAKSAAVVFSNAVPRDNPEYLEAGRLGLPLLSYPQMVGEVSRRYETAAVAGAHGKSTTTAMLSLILAHAGLDPTVLVGTKLKEFKGKNFRSGKSRTLVLEADEYARAFLNYSPASLIVTNIDREHLDIYRDLGDIKRTFLKLCANVLVGGTLVLNADDAHVAALRTRVAKLAKRNRLKVYWYARAGRAARMVKNVLQVPGRHNLSNAIAAFMLATKVFGVPEAKALASLGRYQGSWRRYEYKGHYAFAGANYQVFDDYAHHPTEIRETLAAFREKFPRAALVVVFQPHQADRLRRLFKDFSRSFNDADVGVILPAYHVAGREQTGSRFTAQTLATAAAAQSRKKIIRYLNQPEKLSRQLIRDLVQETGAAYNKAVVVMMGAGTVVNYTPLLVK